jgi:hypothetical protein
MVLGVQLTTSLEVEGYLHLAALALTPLLVPAVVMVTRQLGMVLAAVVVAMLVAPHMLAAQVKLALLFLNTKE